MQDGTCQSAFVSYAIVPIGYTVFDVLKSNLVIPGNALIAKTIRMSPDLKLLHGGLIFDRLISYSIVPYLAILFNCNHRFVCNLICLSCYVLHGGSCYVLCMFV